MEAGSKALRLREAELRLALARKRLAAEKEAACNPPAPAKRPRTVVPPNQHQARQQGQTQQPQQPQQSQHLRPPQPQPRRPPPPTAPAMAQVVLGGASYEVVKGGCALRRAVTAPGSSTSAPTAAAATAAAAAEATAAAAAAQVAAIAARRAVGLGPAPAPALAQAGKARHVSMPGAAFESTHNGMGLQRRAGGAVARPADGKASMTVDFKRQRLKDEARAAKSSVLCAHFCRHGSCTRAGSECPYEHDPGCMAICQPYLHGECDAPPPCVLSHEPLAQRMPVCRLFQLGLCTTAACDFSHVHLGASTKACEAFSRGGYCAEGENCTLRHEMVCDAYAAHRTCALGERCKLGRRPPRPPARDRGGGAAEGGGGGAGGSGTAGELPNNGGAEVGAVSGAVPAGRPHGGVPAIADSAMRHDSTRRGPPPLSPPSLARRSSIVPNLGSPR